MIMKHFLTSQVNFHLMIGIEKFTALPVVIVPNVEHITSLIIVIGEHIKVVNVCHGTTNVTRIGPDNLPHCLQSSSSYKPLPTHTLHSYHHLTSRQFRQVVGSRLGKWFGYSGLYMVIIKPPVIHHIDWIILVAPTVLCL